MAEPEGVAELVHRLLQSAAAKVLVVGVELEPEQRDDAAFCTRLGNAEDEVQIAGIEVDVGDGEHALGPDRKRQAEKGIGMELAALGIERPCGSARRPASSITKPMPLRSRAKSSRARRSGLPTGNRVIWGMSVMGSIDFALSRKRAASGAARGSCGTAPRPAGLAQAVIEVDGVLRQHNCQPPNTPCILPSRATSTRSVRTGYLQERH